MHLNPDRFEKVGMAKKREQAGSKRGRLHLFHVVVGDDSVDIRGIVQIGPYEAQT